jgi:hypothetical protein
MPPILSDYNIPQLGRLICSLRDVALSRLPAYVILIADAPVQLTPLRLG